MTTIVFTKAASGAAGDEILHPAIEDEPWYDKEALVLPKTLMVVGSAAEMDYYLDMYQGKDYKGRFYNTSEGAAAAPKRSDDIRPVMDAVPVKLGSLKLIQGMAPTTNVAVIALEMIGG